MGWEYHNRRRDGRGRFATAPGRNTVQLHLRMTPQQAEYIRQKATSHQMGLGEYVYKAVSGLYSLKAKFDRLREKRRGPLEVMRRHDE